MPSSTPTPVIMAGDVIVGEAVTSAGPAAASGVRELREAEVEHLHHAVRRDLDVRGLQIAMDDALLVGGFEGLADLTRDRQGFVERNRPPGDPIGQRVAFDQFQDERVETRRLSLPRAWNPNRADVRDGSARPAPALRA